MRRGALFVGALSIGACTFTRSLDYLSDGKEVADGGSEDAPTTTADSAVDAGAGTGLPSGVRPEAIALIGSDLYVAGEHGPKGWVGQLDGASLALKASVDVSAADGDTATQLFAIAASPRFGLVLGGTTTRAGAGVGISGSVGLDLTSPALQTSSAGGAGVVTFVADIAGVLWTAGTSVSPAQPWIAADDTTCPLPTSANSSAAVAQLEIASGVADIIVFANRVDQTVTYTRYAGADCNGGGFTPTPQFDVLFVQQPDVTAVAISGNNFYAGGTYEAGAGTFLIPYSEPAGTRTTNQVFTLPGTSSSFVASAHDGDQLFAVGMIGATEGILVAGSAGALTANSKNAVLRIADYHARAIALAPAGNSTFYIAGGEPQGYVLRCDKTAGCPPQP